MKAAILGLPGGHSGSDIHLKQGNSIKLLTAFLKEAETFGVRVSSVNGGSRDNAIAREAEAVFVIPGDKRDALLEFSTGYADAMIAEFPAARLELSNNPAAKKVFSRDFQTRLLDAINSCRHGVVEMSTRIPGIVGTSTNLAIINTAPDEIRICTSQRSENDAKRRELTASLAKHFESYGAVTHIGSEYPGWEPKPDSHLVEVIQNAALEVLGKKMEVTAIHAGLECGVIGAMNPNLEMVSFGPTMNGVHAPGERVNIESVQKCWQLLRKVLENA